MSEPWGVLGYTPENGTIYCVWCINCFEADRHFIQASFPQRGNQQGLWNIYIEDVGPYRLRCLSLCGKVLNPNSQTDFIEMDLMDRGEIPVPSQLFPEEL